MDLHYRARIAGRLPVGRLAAAENPRRLPIAGRAVVITHGGFGPVIPGHGELGGHRAEGMAGDADIVQVNGPGKKAADLAAVPFLALGGISGGAGIRILVQGIETVDNGADIADPLVKELGHHSADLGAAVRQGGQGAALRRPAKAGRFRQAEKVFVKAGNDFRLAQDDLIGAIHGRRPGSRGVAGVGAVQGIGQAAVGDKTRGHDDIAMTGKILGKANPSQGMDAEAMGGDNHRKGAVSDGGCVKGVDQLLLNGGHDRAGGGRVGKESRAGGRAIGKIAEVKEKAGLESAAEGRIGAGRQVVIKSRAGSIRRIHGIPDKGRDDLPFPGGVDFR